jgi:hypothetical protein
VLDVTLPALDVTPQAARPTRRNRPRDPDLPSDEELTDLMAMYDENDDGMADQDNVRPN